MGRQLLDGSRGRKRDGEREKWIGAGDGKVLRRILHDKKKL